VLAQRRRIRSSIRVGLLSSGFLASVGAFAAPEVKVGFCTDELEAAKAAGFDYVELGVRTFTALSDEAFDAFLARKQAVGLPTPVGYLFLPTDLKVVGPATDEARETAYVMKALARAQALGIDTIVFGSGPARSFPEGFPRARAFAQLVAFVKRIAPEARARGIVLSVEAQRPQESNLINTTAEAIEWVRAVDHPNFQVMVDFYHLASVKEDPAILRQAGRIAHVHFANPEGRVFPREASEYDYAPFFANLNQAEHPGRISIEARTTNLAVDGPRAVAFLRQAARRTKAESAALLSQVGRRFLPEKRGLADAVTGVSVPTRLQP